MDWSQNHVRLFRRLLFFYPSEVRHEYGEEMERLFADRLQTERPLRLWLESLADLACTASRERFEAAASDLRYGTRALLKTPAFSIIAILVMALGIAATTAVFSVVNAVLLRSLPYGHADRIVYLWSPNVNFKGIPEELGPNIPDFYDWQRSSKLFSSMAAFESRSINLVSNGRTTQVGAAFVTAGFFRTLEAWPVLGRPLKQSDNRPGQEHVAVISDTFWRSELSSTPRPLGEQVQFNREKYTIVGVMPRDFGYPFDGDIPYEHPEFQRTDVWLPVAYTADQRSNRDHFVSANAIGRLRDGVTRAAAQAELAAKERRLQLLYPMMWRGWTVKIGPLVDTILGPVERMLWLLLGAVAAVLLIAVSNVANMLLARSVARAHEVGIRSALGADRTQIMRQFLAESLIISLSAGAFGVFLAYGAVHILKHLNPGEIPRFDSATIDARVLIVTLMVSIGSGILAGVAPGFFASRADVNDLLKKGGSRLPGAANRSRSAFIVLEIALSMVLLTGAALMIRSYLRLAEIEPGFSRQTVGFAVKLDERYSKRETRDSFLRLFLQRLQRLPGVKAAGATSVLPLSQSESVTGAEIRGVGHSKEMVEGRSVTPDYRRALGTRLLKGRDFSAQDAARSNVVMVNEQFANEYFKGRDPIGQQVRLGMGDLTNAHWLTVVAVVEDLRPNNLEEIPMPQILQPATSADQFAVASDLPPSLILREVNSSLRQLDPALVLSHPATMEERISHSNSRRNFQTTLLLGFAAVATALVLAGLYGLISYSVKTRTSEIGIRLAIGSSRIRIALLIVGQGLRVTMLGLAIGWILSLALMRIISAWLFGISTRDPLTFVLVPSFLLVVAGLACLIPTLPATRVEPAAALRIE